jgi:hypothetical protein
VSAQEESKASMTRRTPQDAELMIPPNAPNNVQDLPEFHNNPNISLNLHHGSGLKGLIASAIAGGAIQFGVVIYAAMITFHPGFRRRIPPYSENLPHLALLGFILLASGTVILTVSLAIVCSIIETSTTEREWVVTNEDNTQQNPTGHGKLRMIWIQRAHSIGDQQFDDAVLLADSDKDTVLTSRRSERLLERIKRDQRSLEDAEGTSSMWANIATDQTEWLVVISTITSLVGFVLQFQGFRYVHWSCSLVQLAAILTMTLVRALLRQGLVVRPRAIRVPYSKLELERLTEVVMSDPRYLNLPLDIKEGYDYPALKSQTILVAYQGVLLYELGDDRSDPNERSTTRHHGLKHRCVSSQCEECKDSIDIREAYYGDTTLAIQTRLKFLTGLKGLMGDYAQAIAMAIELVLDHLVPDGTTFIWVLDLPGYVGISDSDVRSHDQYQIVKYKIVIRRELFRQRKWICEGLACTLESALEFWLVHIQEKRSRYGERLLDLEDPPRGAWFGLGPGPDTFSCWISDWNENG